MDTRSREMLPDLLHHALRPDEAARVESHVASCESCRSELNVLRAVKTATVFAPRIDVNQIVRQIPPYGVTVPVQERPVRPKLVTWLVAASLAVVIALGGSVLNIRGSGESTAVLSNHTHALALAGGVEALSDGDLRQLMTEMNTFDALPSPEPEPVIAVDSGDSVEQDLR